MDGRAQRNAYSAAERAIAALAVREFAEAVRAAEQAARLDQVGAYADLPAAIAAAAASGGDLNDDDWAVVRSALPPGPLQAMVDAHRR